VNPFYIGVFFTLIKKKLYIKERGKKEELPFGELFFLGFKELV